MADERDASRLANISSNVIVPLAKVKGARSESDRKGDNWVDRRHVDRQSDRDWQKKRRLGGKQG